MRKLEDKEICRLLDVSTEYDYIDYDNCETVSTIDIRPALKAQQQQDLKDFIHLIEAGTADGKWLSDILDELKQLLENM